MSSTGAGKHENILRLLPSIDSILESETARRLLPLTGAAALTNFSRTAVESLRSDLLNNGELKLSDNRSREEILHLAEQKLADIYETDQKKRLQPVINATGVIIHTNLGRAPLSKSAQQAIIVNASRYCTLEYDTETGKRGKRGGRAESLLAEITGAEDALVVNNCAAAAILVLSALCKGGEAVVSRGELVEIGGDFRVPDVMEQSGAVMKEVGTTNRTKISDYKKALTSETKLLVKIHPSNYRIVGFTSTPDVKALADLAHENGILFYEDAGSGAIFDFGEFGLKDEPVISRSIADGADVVTFSGDKLLGSAQSGLIVGKKEVIGKLRKHPFYRALRAGKLIYAALEATLDSFRRETHLREIPVLRMMSTTEAEIEERISKFAAELTGIFGEDSKLKVKIVEGKSVIGGGSAPMVQPATKLIALKHSELSVNELEKGLRLSDPPVISRIFEKEVLIDLRTVSENEESILKKLLTEFQ